MKRDNEEILTPQQTALEEIAKIRRHCFDPGDEKIEKLILKYGPERALDILQFAAHFDLEQLAERSDRAPETDQ